MTHSHPSPALRPGHRLYTQLSPDCIWTGRQGPISERSARMVGEWNAVSVQTFSIHSPGRFGEASLPLLRQALIQKPSPLQKFLAVSQLITSHPPNHEQLQPGSHHLNRTCARSPCAVGRMVLPGTNVPVRTSKQVWTNHENRIHTSHLWSPGHPSDSSG
jgi:hypothetical protein